ncbi:MAG: winged helix-turn-helix domain-containing protein [Pirellulaceae bacterium]|nr:winged helix-turn-helix domain-containing protein [Pirellulaceae bacterium]
MSTDGSTPVSCVEQIGQIAGLVWHALNESGPQSMAKLVKTVDAPRDMVLQAVGWLAREDKVCIEDAKRGRIIGLR